LVADALQVPMQQVRVVHGDTAEIERGTGTFASRSMSLGGSAAVTAAARVVEKGRRIAAHQLEATLADVEATEGGFAVAGAQARLVTWQEIKGVGEAGTNGCPPAIVNAVMDALSPLGIQHLDLPFTSDRVWQAIQSATS
jgi:carbon-monoxide dehydrogenase large subunit